MSGKTKGHKVITVESKSHYQKLIEDAGQTHVLIEFYATWCAPCRIIGVRLEELAHEYADKLVILKIDVDDLEELAVEFDVSSMPTFAIVKNKVIVEKFVGSNPDKVESTLVKYCGKPDATAATATASASPAKSGAGSSKAVAEAANGKSKK
ncbi:thioredoxin-2 [Scaptodrosophila lebanonensis]|uniref:Thioredoxin-2 n=1 Tax=Drosophila lebanonensis TaxID=7225 RepID=A0A6J2UB85_DROLE|nr:thioredoxin-2 [Scaptodrosophila lebanonensis]